MAPSSFLHLAKAQYEWGKECPPETKNALSSYFLSPEFLDRPDVFFFGFDEDQMKWVSLISMDGIKSTRHAITHSFNYEFMDFYPSAASFTKIEPAPRMAKSQAYSKFSKAIQKLNNQMKALHRLLSYQKTLESATKIVMAHHPPTTIATTSITSKISPLRFISVDIESYERDHALILEIGWSTWDTGLNKFLDRHFAVQDYRHLSNGRYVDDRRDRFLFGETCWASLKECIATFQQDLDLAAQLNPEGTVALIAHDMASDESYLRRMGVDFPPGMIKFDTVEMNSARMKDSNAKTGLGKLLDEVGIENYCLHNAGNDAHYTLQLFMWLCRDHASKQSI
ncbi:hypothetical protein BG004_003616 [Podila humilis]|nr:hypothetical protein BG004_003616 [Podila humilis]